MDDIMLKIITNQSQMSCPKEDHEELSTFAGSLSPKSLFSLVSLDSDEEPRV